MNPNVIIAFLLSFSLAFIITKSIIHLCNRLNVGDAPDGKRKIHQKKIPNLGGISIFIATSVSYFAFSDYANIIRPDKLFSIAIFMFFIGVYDDIEPMGVKVRLFLEFLCAFFIIYITDIRMVSLWGIFGITDLSLIPSYILSTLFIVGCINAFNFIDGIDGLLGFISLLAAVCFGFIFKLYGEWLWTLLAVCITGALIAFLWFNRSPAKIFMGDGGSLFLGTIFSCFALRLMQLPMISGDFLFIQAPHTIAFAIVAIPIVDITVVIALRLIHKRSPLRPDNRHAHHRLLAMDLSHGKSVLILGLANISIVLFAYFVQSAGALRSFVFTVLYCFLLELLLIYLSYLYKKKKTIISN